MNAPTTIARFVSRARAQRFVAYGRVIVSAVALFAAIVGKIQGWDGPATIAILASWLALAAVLLWHARRRRGALSMPAAVVVDTFVIAVVILTTDGVASPFFPLLVLPPFVVGFLYGPKRVAWMIPVGITIYLAALVATDGVVDPRMTIMRFAVVVLLAIGVLRRANYDTRLQEDLERLATWPRTLTDDREETIRGLLEHAALTLRAPRAALIWSEADGSAYTAILGDPFIVEEEELRPILTPELGDASSFLEAGTREGLRNVRGSIEPFVGACLASDIRTRLDSPTILGARFSSQAASGWLFLLDVRAADADDVMLAEVVARLVSAGIEQLALAEMIRDGAAAKERLRLSRDLHDGLLQSLSSLALQAQIARRSLGRDPREAERRLGDVVEQLADTQHGLREFVDELRPELLLRRQPLAERLQQLAQSIGRQWNVPVSLSIDGDVDPGSANDIAAIVGEALTNAAKHAGATRIEARVRADAAGIHVDVVDDGRGFPFHGRYELAQLVADQRGPWSLKERVASLGGGLAIESSSHGSRVEVRLPRAS